jgi:hypothetical protein
MANIANYIESIIDEPNTKVEFIGEVYNITTEFVTNKISHVDYVYFIERNIRKRLILKLDTYLPPDTKYKLIIHAKPNYNTKNYNYERII